jgi:hypothetical protein
VAVRSRASRRAAPVENRQAAQQRNGGPRTASSPDIRSGIHASDAPGPWMVSGQNGARSVACSRSSTSWPTMDMSPRLMSSAGDRRVTTKPAIPTAMPASMPSGIEWLASKGSVGTNGDSAAAAASGTYPSATHAGVHSAASAPVAGRRLCGLPGANSWATTNPTSA